MTLASERAVTHATFSIERRYDASTERVWRAYEDEASFRRWFVEGEGWTIHEWVHDFRIGGRSRGRFRFGDESQPTYFNETFHLDLVPGVRMVIAYVMGRETPAGPERFSASLATTELVADGAATTLTYTEQAAFFGDRAPDGPQMREHGWAGLLDRLTKELARPG